MESGLLNKKILLYGKLNNKLKFKRYMETGLTVLTPEVVKSKLAVKLLSAAELSIQKLNDEEAKLVYNEDEENLNKIADFIKRANTAEKTIEAERVKMKESPLEQGRVIDQGAKLISTELTAIKKKAHDKYTEMCLAIQKKQQENAAEEKRKADLKLKVNNTLLAYAEQIAGCDTLEQLMGKERLLNLELTHPEEWGELFEEFKTRSVSIRELIKGQKENIKKLSSLNNQEQNALANELDEELQEVITEKETIQTKIEETKIKVQESVSNQALSSGSGGYTQVFPTVKEKRKTWKFEVVDVLKLQKAHPEMVQLVADESKIKEFLNKKSVDKTLKEETIDGLRIYQQKTF